MIQRRFHMGKSKFNHILSVLSCILVLAGCSSVYQVEVGNDSSLDRIDEMVEIPLSELPKLSGKSFRITDSNKEEVAYQITSDSLLIFRANVSHFSSSTYNISKGIPAPVDTIACGSHRPDRLDDLIWENDKSGYRTYGPALQKRGERAFGYDVFTKSVTYPVMKARFDSTLYSKSRPSFHIDHGNGMDSYAVGPTLGCGTTALLHDGGIVFPWCWTSYEISDNGPLRFRVRLAYSHVMAGNNIVTEYRTITCDAGSLLNKAEISYSGTTSQDNVVAGVVVHKENPEAYRFSREKRYIGYADLGDRNIGQNGEIYVGTVFSSLPDSVWFKPVAFQEPIRKNRKPVVAEPVGHVIGSFGYTSGDTFTYWFGSGWSKAGIQDLGTWCRLLEEFGEKKGKPLTVKVL